MLNINKKMIALIMIGGQSTRMGGGIKSLIEFNQRNIFDRILERATPQIEKIIINCNSDKKKLKKYNIPIIEDLKQGYQGPLAGIHTAMSWIKENDPQNEWLITLPGDTPFIPSNLISKFNDKMLNNTKIILAQSNNKTHPIIGAWHVSLLDSLDIQLNKGIKKIMSWANLHKIDFVSFPCKEYDPFFNINKPEDIITAKEIEKNFIEKT